MKSRKQTTHAKAKRAAWAACSEYIRRKYASKRGIVFCYTCGSPWLWSQMDAGHAAAGRSNGVLFEEDLLRPQCRPCNQGEGGRTRTFQQNLEKELGKDRLQELLARKHQAVKLTTQDLLEKKAEFEKKTEELKGAENGL